MSNRGVPSDLIERARAVPIESVIERRGVKLRGKTDRCGPCPRCGGQDRFSINVREQVFNCRGCGAKGDVIALVQFLDGVDFKTAVETLSGERMADEAPAGLGPAKGIYDYVDEAGELLFQALRFEPAGPPEKVSPAHRPRSKRSGRLKA